MNQTFINSETGLESTIDVLHTFEINDEKDRNIIVFKENNKYVLAYVKNDKIEIIEDNEELYNKSIERLNIIEKDAKISPDDANLIDEVFFNIDNLNLKETLETIDKYQQELLSKGKDYTYNERKLKEAKLGVINIPKQIDRIKNATHNIPNKDEEIRKLEEQLRNCTDAVVTFEQKVSDIKDYIDNTKSKQQIEIDKLEDAKDKVTIEIHNRSNLNDNDPKKISKEKLPALEYALEQKYKNYLKGKRYLKTIDVRFEQNMEDLSKNILIHKSELLQRNYMVAKIETEQENIERLEKEITEKIKQRVINVAERKFSGKKLEEVKEQINNRIGPKIQVYIDQKLGERKQKLQDTINSPEYQTMLNDKKEIEEQLKNETVKYDKKVEVLQNNLDDINMVCNKIQANLQVMQITNDLKNGVSNLPKEDKQILEKFEELKRKQLSAAYKIKKYNEKINNSKYTEFDRKMFRKTKEKAVNQKKELEEKLAIMSSDYNDVITKSMYSDPKVSQYLLFDKQCRDTAEYLKKEIKRQEKINAKNKKQMDYREIQRQNIEHNDSATREEDVRETSLRGIIREQKNPFKKLGRKIESTGVYQKIVNSKVADKATQTKLYQKLHKGVMFIKESRQERNEFIDRAENPSNYRKY